MGQQHSMSAAGMVGVQGYSPKTNHSQLDNGEDVSGYPHPSASPPFLRHKVGTPPEVLNGEEHMQSVRAVIDSFIENCLAVSSDEASSPPVRASSGHDLGRVEVITVDEDTQDKESAGPCENEVKCQRTRSEDTFCEKAVVEVNHVDKGGDGGVGGGGNMAVSEEETSNMDGKECSVKNSSDNVVSSHQHSDNSSDTSPPVSNQTPSDITSEKTTALSVDVENRTGMENQNLDKTSNPAEGNSTTSSIPVSSSVPCMSDGNSNRNASSQTSQRPDSATDPKQSEGQRANTDCIDSVCESPKHTDRGRILHNGETVSSIQLKTIIDHVLDTSLGTDAELNHASSNPQIQPQGKEDKRIVQGVPEEKSSTPISHSDTPTPTTTTSNNNNNNTDTNPKHNTDSEQRTEPRTMCFMDHIEKAVERSFSSINEEEERLEKEKLNAVKGYKVSNSSPQASRRVETPSSTSQDAGGMTMSVQDIVDRVISKTDVISKMVTTTTKGLASHQDSGPVMLTAGTFVPGRSPAEIVTSPQQQHGFHKDSSGPMKMSYRGHPRRHSPYRDPRHHSGQGVHQSSGAGPKGLAVNGGPEILSTVDYLKSMHATMTKYGTHAVPPLLMVDTMMGAYSPLQRRTVSAALGLTSSSVHQSLRNAAPPSSATAAHPPPLLKVGERTVEHAEGIHHHQQQQYRRHDHSPHRLSKSCPCSSCMTHDSRDRELKRMHAAGVERPVPRRSPQTLVHPQPVYPPAANQTVPQGWPGADVRGPKGELGQYRQSSSRHVSPVSGPRDDRVMYSHGVGEVGMERSPRGPGSLGDRAKEKHAELHHSRQLVRPDLPHPPVRAYPGYEKMAVADMGSDRHPARHDMKSDRHQDRIGSGRHASHVDIRTERHAPHVVVGPERHAPHVVVGPERHAPHVDIGPERHAPHVDIGPERHAPHVVVGPERHAPHVVGPERHAPHVVVGPERHAPHVDIGPERHAPHVDIGPERHAPHVDIGPERHHPPHSMISGKTVPVRPQPRHHPQTLVPGGRRSDDLCVSVTHRPNLEAAVPEDNAPLDLSTKKSPAGAGPHSVRHVKENCGCPSCQTPIDQGRSTRPLDSHRNSFVTGLNRGQLSPDDCATNFHGLQRLKEEKLGPSNQHLETSVAKYYQKFHPHQELPKVMPSQNGSHAIPHSVDNTLQSGRRVLSSHNNSAGGSHGSVSVPTPVNARVRQLSQSVGADKFGALSTGVSVPESVRVLASQNIQLGVPYSVSTRVSSQITNARVPSQTHRDIPSQNISASALHQNIRSSASAHTSASVSHQSRSANVPIHYSSAGVPYNSSAGVPNHIVRAAPPPNITVNMDSVQSSRTLVEGVPQNVKSQASGPSLPARPSPQYNTDSLSLSHTQNFTDHLPSPGAHRPQPRPSSGPHLTSSMVTSSRSAAGVHGKFGAPTVPMAPGISTPPGLPSSYSAVHRPSSRHQHGGGGGGGGLVVSEKSFSYEVKVASTSHRSIMGKEDRECLTKREPTPNNEIHSSPRDLGCVVCRLCRQTYSSPFGFRKHFLTQHGFEPKAEDVLIQTIPVSKNLKQLSSGGHRSMDMDRPPGEHLVPPSRREPQVRAVSAHLPPVCGPTPEEGPRSRSCESSAEAQCRGDRGLRGQGCRALVDLIPHSMDTKDGAKPGVGSGCSVMVKCKDTKCLECPECGQGFQLNDFGSYKRHCRQHGQGRGVVGGAGGASVFTCKECQQSFPEAQLLEEHLIQHQTHTANITCTICHISFPSSSACQDHVCAGHRSFPKEPSSSSSSSEKVTAQTGSAYEQVTAQTGSASEQVAAQTGSASEQVTAQTGSASEHVTAQTGSASEHVTAQTGLVSASQSQARTPSRETLKTVTADSSVSSFSLMVNTPADLKICRLPADPVVMSASPDSSSDSKDTKHNSICEKETGISSVDEDVRSHTERLTVTCPVSGSEQSKTDSETSVPDELRICSAKSESSKKMLNDKSLPEEDRDSGFSDGRMSDESQPVSVEDNNQKDASFSAKQQDSSGSKEPEEKPDMFMYKHKKFGAHRKRSASSEACETALKKSCMDTGDITPTHSPLNNVDKTSGKPAGKSPTPAGKAAHKGVPGVKGMPGKTEARHQMPVVVDRVTRSKAGKMAGTSE